MEIKPKIQYAIWIDEDDKNQYYEFFESIEDAVLSTYKKPVEVFEVNYKSLGHYEIKNVLQKKRVKK